MPGTNRQWKVEGRQSFDVLKLHDGSPVPTPEGAEVLIKVKAVSFNYRDVAIIFDKYPAQVKDNLIPLSDGAGVIEAVGPNVTSFKVGDKVWPTCTPHWVSGRAPQTFKRSLGNTHDGVLQDYITIEESGVVPIPSNYDFVQASTLACAGVTAWNALYGCKRLQPGDWVLTQGTGGVSLFALQFAKAAGARVVATTSSNDKAKILEQLGADHIINYREDKEWGLTARKLTTNGEGFDHVIDVGGSSTVKQSLDATAKDGIISMIGFLGGGDTPDVMQVLYRGVIMRGIGIGPRVMAEEMVRSIEANGIEPNVDEVFDFEDVKEAYKHMEKQDFVGKVVIKIE